MSLKATHDTPPLSGRRVIAREVIHGRNGQGLYPTKSGLSTPPTAREQPPTTMTRRMEIRIAPSRAELTGRSFGRRKISMRTAYSNMKLPTTAQTGPSNTQIPMTMACLTRLSCTTTAPREREISARYSSWKSGHRRKAKGAPK